MLTISAHEVTLDELNEEFGITRGTSSHIHRIKMSKVSIAVKVLVNGKVKPNLADIHLFEKE